MVREYSRNNQPARDVLAAEIRLYRRWLHSTEEEWARRDLLLAIEVLREFGWMRLPKDR